MARTAIETVRRFELCTAADVQGDRRDRELQILAGLNALEVAVSQRIAEIVQICRDQGASWAEIAATLHVSKQAAHERFTQRRPAPAHKIEDGVQTDQDRAASP